MEESDSYYDRGREVLKRSAVECPDPHTRRYAILLLSREKDPDLLPVYVAGLKDGDKGVREQSARALAEIGNPASAALMDLIRDKEWRVRYRAAEAFGLMAASPGTPVLIKVLHDEKDHVRYMAAKSLGLIGDPASLEPLIERLSDDNEFVSQDSRSITGKNWSSENAIGDRHGNGERTGSRVGEAMSLALAGVTLSGPELED